MHQLLSYINICDIDSLRSYWNHLESRIFSRFEQQHLSTVKRMEFNLYKFYLVNCMQNGKRKECFDFFEKYSQVKTAGLISAKRLYIIVSALHCYHLISRCAIEVLSIGISSRFPLEFLSFNIPLELFGTTCNDFWAW